MGDGIARHHPPRYVRMQPLHPLVFQRRVVKGYGDLAKPLGDEDGRDRRGHDHHDIDQQQFAALQPPRWPQPFEHRVDERGQREEQQDGADGAEAQRHIGPLQIGRAVGYARSDSGGHNRTEQKGPRGKGLSRGRCLCHGHVVRQPGAELRRQQATGASPRVRIIHAGGRIRYWGSLGVASNCTGHRICPYAPHCASKKGLPLA